MSGGSGFVAPQRPSFGPFDAPEWALARALRDALAAFTPEEQETLYRIENMPEGSSALVAVRPEALLAAYKAIANWDAIHAVLDEAADAEIAKLSDDQRKRWGAPFRPGRIGDDGRFAT